MSENRYAVLVGNSRYPLADSLADLRCPERDVDGLHKALSTPPVEFTEVVVAKDLAHHQALKEIHRVLKKAKREDLVLVYYSGHGKLDAANRLHLCTVDTEISALEATAIPVQSIKNFIDIAETRKVGLILDCCFSGAAGGVFAKGGIDDQLSQISRGRGIYVLAASTAIQPAVEKESDDYSVFTKHLIGGIEGGADGNGDGRITLDELYDYVHHQVLNEGAQEPMKWSVNVQGDFVLTHAKGPHRREERNRLRKRLVELAEQGVLPDSVLASTMQHLSSSAGPGSTVLNRLLDDLLKGTITVGEFVDGWLNESARLGSRDAGARGRLGGLGPAVADQASGPEQTPADPHLGSMGLLGRDRRESPSFSGGGDAAGDEISPGPVPGGRQARGVEQGLVAAIRSARWAISAPRRRPGMIAAALAVGLGVYAIVNPSTTDSALVFAPMQIDFEDGRLPPTFQGDWRLSNAMADGGWSLETPSMRDDQQAGFRLVLPAGITTVDFDYYTDTEECCDVLNVWLDNAPLEPDQLTSQGYWSSQHYRFEAVADSSVIEWEYRKDGSLSEGRDRIWVDNIRFGRSSAEVLSWIDFEGGSLPPGLSGEWVLSTTYASDGAWSLESPAIGDNQSAGFELVTPPAASVVTFDFRTDTEGCCDHLTVLFNGETLAPSALTSDEAWTTQSYRVPARAGGPRVLRWEYRKDGSVSDGADRVWVDAIRFSY